MIGRMRLLAGLVAAATGAVLLSVATASQNQDTALTAAGGVSLVLIVAAACLGPLVARAASIVPGRLVARVSPRQRLPRHRRNAHRTAPRRLRDDTTRAQRRDGLHAAVLPGNPGRRNGSPGARAPSRRPHRHRTGRSPPRHRAARRGGARAHRAGPLALPRQGRPAEGRGRPRGRARHRQGRAAQRRGETAQDPRLGQPGARRADLPSSPRSPRSTRWP